VLRLPPADFLKTRGDCKNNLMKKVILLFIIAIGSVQLRAQNINPEFDYVPGPEKKAPKEVKNNGYIYTYAGMHRSDWCVDVNATGGFAMQKITGMDPATNYTNALNKNISNTEYRKGLSAGLDVQLDYFFGTNREFGIGSGIMYMHQWGELTMDNFHVEYQATDFFGNTFRQVLTTNGQIREKVKTSNLNIPILFKYRTNIAENVGFTAEAGVLFNLMEENHYEASSSIDYEAIYQYTGAEGSVKTVYDNSPVPAANDLLITKKQYLGTHSDAAIQDYFNTLRSDGYNVGLGVVPKNNSGTISYNGGSLGIFVRPAVSIALSRGLALNVGVYYAYQNFNHDAATNYRLTNKLGEYNSMMNGVTNAGNHMLGISAGIRYSLSGPAHILIHRYTEEEPVAIAEPEPEPVDESPVASPVIEEPQPIVDISTPILFDIGKVDVSPAAYPQMDAALKKLTENSKSTLVIHGYTDNTGKAKFNQKLSKKRAESVKTYLKYKGVPPKRMQTVGHGEKSPAASNKTPEGRAKNRRVIMKLKTGK
jgi:outer membrane protein OmpA-like peptidoglycan-associated protein